MHGLMEHVGEPCANSLARERIGPANGRSHGGRWLLGAYIDATADETAAPRGEMPFSFYARFDSALFFHSMPTNPMCCTTSLGGDLAGAFRGASCHQAGAVVSAPFGSI